MNAAALTLAALLSNPAHAGEKTWYYVACENGRVSLAFKSDFEAEASASGYCESRMSTVLAIYAGDGPRSARNEDTRNKIIRVVEKDIAEKERIEKERAEKERAEKERIEKERIEKERIEKERERESCRSKMTYQVKVWACPFAGEDGKYVSDPSQCKSLPGRTSTALAAVEVDTHYSILPPGESCVGYWADVTHEKGLASVLHKANHEYRGEPKPEGFDVDVKTPVETAGKAWLALEKARKATMTYDCLAGVCLNTPASSIPDKLVTVSGTKVHRIVEVCSGRVVEVSVHAGWVHPRYGGFADLLPGAEHATYSDGAPATEYVYQIRSEMEVLGWEKTTYGDKFHYTHVSPTKMGERSTGWGRATNGGAWYMYLTTTHPDYTTLCAPKRQQGL